ncbi:MAG TPA: hypothetical protein VHC22_34210 [Pirellulales bacterium]|nr:hypothetical protein [Pirellulales bacterium]
MRKWNAIGLLVLVLPAPATTADEPAQTKPKPPVWVHVSFSVEEYDPSTPSKATMRCVLRNDTRRGVHVPVGFDGGYVQVQSGLMTLIKHTREKEDAKLVWVEPGQEQVVFELPLDDIFLVAENNQPKWHWHWMRRPEPPRSPIHKYRQPGFLDEAILIVSLDLGGSVLKSEAGVLKVKPPAGEQAPDEK